MMKILLLIFPASQTFMGPLAIYAAENFGHPATLPVGVMKRIIEENEWCTHSEKHLKTQHLCIFLY
jgi:hypothetical protein